jgi:hypothetical protein
MLRCSLGSILSNRRSLSQSTGHAKTAKDCNHLEYKGIYVNASRIARHECLFFMQKQRYKTKTGQFFRSTPPQVLPYFSAGISGRHP